MGFFDKFRRKNSVTAATAVPVGEGFFNAPIYTGSKYPGGLTSILDEVVGLDYWSLRKRSAALFYNNAYARGIVRRFVTNIINTGLSVEVKPDEELLGLPEDALVDWSDIIEKRFGLWAESPALCDIKEHRCFGELQAQIYREALVGGDCLVIIRQDSRTNLPRLQIIPGDRVRSPVVGAFDPSIIDGVKIDGNGRHLGYFVDGVYIAARGELTGRAQAWMVYGVDKREDGVRGEPLLAVAIQPLKEIDRYRDSAQRKAVINSMIAGFVKRTDANKSQSLQPQKGGARRVTTVQGTGTTDQPISFGEILPGLFMSSLNPGEEPTPFSTNGTDVNFGAFEATIICGLAWALEMPPEILTLGFEKNYSASQAAVNEWKTFQNKERNRFGQENNDRVFQEWFLSELLMGKFAAPGYLEAYADPMKYDIRAAWTFAGWSGAIKPSVDLTKLVSGYQALVQEGWITNERTSRELTGSKFGANIRRLKKENQMKMDAVAPILDAEKQYGQEEVARALRVVGEA